MNFRSIKNHSARESNDKNNSIEIEFGALKESIIVDITEVRIKLMGENDDRLQAFCSITFDSEFVVRDLKIIEGQRGLFIAMPSRKLTTKCHKCVSKNDLRARYCSGCGVRLPDDSSGDSRSRLFADIAHPINASCREKIQTAVLNALEQERERSKQAGYVCTYDDFDDFYSEARSR